jgi:hypothetical protein
LPASVEAIATVSHAVSRSCSRSMKGFSTSTAGTLLTRFDRIAVTPLSTGTRSRPRRPTASNTGGVSSARSAPATMMNRPANISSRDQSISA